MMELRAKRFTSGNLLFLNSVHSDGETLTLTWPRVFTDKKENIGIYGIKDIHVDEHSTPSSSVSIVVRDFFDSTFKIDGFDRIEAKKFCAEIVATKKDLENKRLESLKHSLQRLDSLQGLNELKTLIQDTVKLRRYYKETGENSMLAMHMVFKGNPGTGKTTVARLIGEILYLEGVLFSNNFVECSRVDLVAEFIGQTAPKTLKMCEKALDGILFIDEAYSLSGHPDMKHDFGKEAIETLLKFMEDNRDRLCVIVAGYSNLMNQFITSNPGLKSRFTHFIDFSDFNEEQLFQIAKDFFDKEKIEFSVGVEHDFFKQISNVYTTRDTNFGNGRVVRNLCEAIVRNYDLRMAEMYNSKENEIDRTLISADFIDVFEAYISINKSEESQADAIGY
jgi:SpoVK/Ycf46/Vps4 family AAA+-type ATPase